MNETRFEIGEKVRVTLENGKFYEGIIDSVWQRSDTNEYTVKYHDIDSEGELIDRYLANIKETLIERL